MADKTPKTQPPKATPLKAKDAKAQDLKARDRKARALKRQERRGPPIEQVRAALMRRRRLNVARLDDGQVRTIFNRLPKRVQEAYLKGDDAPPSNEPGGGDASAK